MFKVHWRQLCFCFFVVTVVGLPLAQSRAGAEAVRLCFTRWEPYAYDNGDGHGPTGLAIDIARRAFELSGREVTFVQMPHSRCHIGIRLGLYDGILFESLKEKPVEKLVTSRFALINRVLVAVVRDSYPHTRYRGLDTFEGANWLRIVGDDYPEKIINDPDMYPVDVGENAHGLLMLRRNYVDVVFRDLASLHFGADAVKGATGLKTLLPAVDVEPFYMRLEERLAPVMQAYDDATAKMLSDGSIDRLFYKHLGFSQIAFNHYFSGTDTPVLPQDRLMP
ncbi:ABC transporter substrate-binding protein [Thalassospira sp. TSL5-1]|uniref:substrate-binding periplasmic protein n=1 Tax=Thalassospira sp. TSL5-1 TaxID=1544451 RepID=UPI000B2E5860|nr:transporter substrate-binding domain-containing protein [Thalassospira sp. TSL5-1]